jgi:hypothetical protein
MTQRLSPPHKYSLQPLFHLKLNHFLHLSRAIFLAAMCLTTACAQTPTANPPGKPTATSLAALSSPTAMPAPTARFTPTQITPAVILLSPGGSDQSLVNSLKDVINEKAAAIGWAVTLLDRWAASDVHPGVRLVVVVSPDPGVVALAAANPAIQFVAIEITGIKPASNLSLIGGEGDRANQRAFLAGYLAAQVTPDWRVGVAYPSEANQGAIIKDAFKNGARYFCGLCKPAYPPFVIYPQSAMLENPIDKVSWQTAADNLIGNSVKTVYVPPQSSSSDLLDYLDRAKVNLIGEQIPSGQKYGHWLASIHADPGQALTQLWSDLMAGKGGASIALPLIVSDMNPSMLTSGKMRLINEILDGLTKGQINPDPVPEP